MKNKNLLYFVATLLGIVIVALFFSKPQPQQAADGNPAASPTNGLVGTTTGSAAVSAPDPSNPPAPSSVPTPAEPNPAAAPADGLTNSEGGDELPAGAEVSGEGANPPAAVGMPAALPPGEGR